MDGLAVCLLIAVLCCGWPHITITHRTQCPDCKKTTPHD